MTMVADSSDEELSTAREVLRSKLTTCLDAELTFRRMSSQRIASLLSSHLGHTRTDYEAEAHLRRIFRQVLVQERKKLKEIQKSLSSNCPIKANSLTESISLEIKSQSNRLAAVTQENNKLRDTITTLKEETQNQKYIIDKLKSTIESKEKGAESEVKLRSQLDGFLKSLEVKEECIRQLTEARSIAEGESKVLKEEVKQLTDQLNTFRKEKQGQEEHIQKLVKAHHEELNELKADLKQSETTSKIPSSTISELKEQHHKEIDHLKAKLFDFEKEIQDARLNSKNLETKYSALEKKLQTTQKKLKTAEKGKANKASAATLAERPIFSPVPEAQSRQVNARESEAPAESNFSVTPFVKAQKRRTRSSTVAISPTRPHTESESQSSQPEEVSQPIRRSNPLAAADVNLPPSTQTASSGKGPLESDSSKLNISTGAKFSFFSDDEENRTTEEEASFLLSKKTTNDKRTTRKRKLASTNRASSIFTFDDQGDEPSPRPQVPSWPQGLSKEISPVKKRNKNIASMFRL